MFTPGEARVEVAGSPLAHVFLGPNGLRAGWRLLVFLLIAAITSTLLNILAQFVRDFANLSLRSTAFAFSKGVDFASLLTSAAIMARLEHRRFADYGLPKRGAFGLLFWEGALWGFTALSILLAGLHVAHAYSLGTLSLHGAAIWFYAAFWGVSFLLVGLNEEFLMRGYAMFTLASGMGFWPSAFLLSAVFGALHLRNAGESWAGVLSAMAIGMFFCLTLRRTGDLWFAVGFHAAWDFSQSFLYSVPDSGAILGEHLLNSSSRGPSWLTGGSVGPEGSVLVFFLIAAAYFLFHRLHREVRFPNFSSVSMSHANSASPPAVPKAPDQ